MIQHCKCNHPYVSQERITLQLIMGAFHLENECLSLSSSDFQPDILGIRCQEDSLDPRPWRVDEID